MKPMPLWMQVMAIVTFPVWLTLGFVLWICLLVLAVPVYLACEVTGYDPPNWARRR